MPVNLSVKAVPNDLAARLRERAAANHRSLQGELMAILEGAAQSPVVSARAPGSESPEWLRRAICLGSLAAEPLPPDVVLDRIRTRLPQAPPGESSVDLVRHMRDSRHGPGMAASVKASAVRGKRRAGRGE